MYSENSSPVTVEPRHSAQREFQPAHAVKSFRDPDGSLVRAGEFMIRILTASGRERIETLEALATVQRLQAEGHWIASEPVADEAGRIRHPRVFFPSYPHEWAPAMLHRAASLTLHIDQALLEEGWELKDGTPTNVLFDGPRPLFVDHLSPVQRDPGQMGWRAYGQFTRTFLIPLALERRLHIPLNWQLLGHRDGISPEQAQPLVRGLKKFWPGLWSLVTLPNWMAHLPKGIADRANLARSTSEPLALQVSARILMGLGKHLERLRSVPPKQSTWLNYQDEGISYTAEALAAKEMFVEECLKSCHPATVLDLGCNTGKFSKAAARAGAKVVALDSDVACVERLFLEAEAERLDILPLWSDLGRPAPAMGWNYQEEESLLQRMAGRFDLTLGLALIHHLLVKERTGLEAAAEFFASTTRGHILIEWVPPEDPQFRSLSGPNQALYEGLTWEQAMACFAPQFRESRSLALPGSLRSLHLLARNS